MGQDPTPNLFAIQDLQSRQAHKVTWDALNALRTEKRLLAESVTALQDDVTKLRASTASQAGLPAVLSALNVQASIAQDHPFLSMTLSADVSIPDSVPTQLAWDVERFPLAGIHSPIVNNTKVFVGNKPGIWLSVLSIWWATNAVGVRLSDTRGVGSFIMNSYRAPGFVGAANTQPSTTLIVATGTGDIRRGDYTTA